MILIIIFFKCFILLLIKVLCHWLIRLHCLNVGIGYPLLHNVKSLPKNISKNFFSKIFPKIQKVEQNVFLPDATRCRDRRSVVGW